MSRLLLIWACAALGSATESHGLEGINLMRRETPQAGFGPSTGGAVAESEPTLDAADKELQALAKNAEMQKAWAKAAEDEWHNAAKAVGEEDDRAEQADDDDKDDKDDDADSAARPRLMQEAETPTASGESQVLGSLKEAEASAPHAQVAASAAGSLEQHAGAKLQANSYEKTLGRAPEHRRRGWSDAHKFENHDPHSNTHLFDCTQVQHWRYAWSKLKLEWCCSNMNVGCPEHVEAMKHEENATQELHKHANHGNELKFDCTSDYSRWPTSWSTLKQEWCCMYNKPPLGCKHKLSDGKMQHSFLAGTTVCKTEDEGVCKMVGCCHWTQEHGCISSVGSSPCQLPDTWHNSYDDSYYYNQHTYPQYPVPPNYAGAPEPGAQTAYGTYPHTPEAVAANTPNYNPWFQEVQNGHYPGQNGGQNYHYPGQVQVHHHYYYPGQNGGQNAGQNNFYGGGNGEQPFYGQYQHDTMTIPVSDGTNPEQVDEIAGAGAAAVELSTKPTGSADYQ